MDLAFAHLLLDHAPAAVAAIDERGVITYWNPRAEQIFGHTAQQAVGTRLADLAIPETLRDDHRARLARLLGTGGDGAVREARREMAIRCADGAELPVDVAVVAIRGESGWTVYAFADDISARREGEQERERLVRDLRRALHGSERRFDAIVGSLSDAVTIRDHDDRIVYANQAAVEHLGFRSWAELEGISPFQIMADYRVTGKDGRPISMDDLPSVRLLRGETAVDPLLIQTVNRRTGRRRWELLKSAPLLDDSGDIEATIMIIEDVTARQRAEHEAAFLVQASEVLASSLDYEQTLRNVAELAVPGIVDWCAVDLMDERGERLAVAVAHADPGRLRLAEELRTYEPEQLDPTQGLGLVFRTGEPLLYPAIGDAILEQAAVDERHLQLLREVGFRSAMIVPVRLGERTLGAMTLVTADSERTLDESDLRLAQQVAARAAVAIENSRIYSERSQVAHTLQQSLLPDRLPDIPGYELAAIYTPAVQGNEVGGDFYDAWEIDGGWVMVIGDVTGKGVTAAALTAVVRHTLRAASAFETRPAALLAHVDGALKTRRTLSICTALCVRLRGDEVTLAVGGHPLPLYLSDGGVQQVGVSGPLLGAFSDVGWEEVSFVLAAGGTLVTYTDGVTDAVGDDGSRYGHERLHARLGSWAGRGAGAIVAHLNRELEEFQSGAHADDTAVLVVHRPAGRAPDSVISVASGASSPG